MRLWVEPEIFHHFPGMRIVGLVASGIDNADPHGTVAADWDAAWQQAGALAERWPNAQSHPNVAAWRQAMKQVGVSHKDAPSSIEAMLRRAMKGGPPVRINPLVDLLNAVSLRWVVPAGGWDVAEVRDDVALRRTMPGDLFHSLDAPEPVEVAAGEVAYADGNAVLTRHFVWRQSREALIQPASQDVLLVSEVLDGLGVGLVDDVREDLAARVAAAFGVPVRTFTLDEGTTEVSWERQP